MESRAPKKSAAAERFKEAAAGKGNAKGTPGVCVCAANPDSWLHRDSRGLCIGFTLNCMRSCR